METFLSIVTIIQIMHIKLIISCNKTKYTTRMRKSGTWDVYYPRKHKMAQSHSNSPPFSWLLSSASVVLPDMRQNNSHKQNQREATRVRNTSLHHLFELRNEISAYSRYPSFKHNLFNKNYIAELPYFLRCWKKTIEKQILQ